MDYESLAEELLQVKGKLLQVPVHRELSRMQHGEMFVLNYLKYSNEIVHPKELSEKLAVSTARIARLLKRLEDEKLIIRHTDARDSRQVVVQLTERGAEEVERARKSVLEHAAHMLEALGQKDAQEYIRIQGKICQMHMSTGK